MLETCSVYQLMLLLVHPRVAKIGPSTPAAKIKVNLEWYN